MTDVEERMREADAPEIEERGEGIPTDEDVEEARRELAEHNALARVFDDVRERSRNGLLTDSSRWTEAGLVPEHMEPAVFALFVREYWKSEHPDGNVPAPEASDGAAGADVQTGARSVSPAHAQGSVIQNVGVPPFLRKQHDGGASDAAPAEGAAADDAPASDDASADAARSADAAAGGSVAGSAAAADAAPAVVSDAADVPADAGDDPFAGLKLPEGYKLVELEGEWVLVPDEDAEPVELTVDCENVALLEGRHGFYLYDRGFMTDAFARWAFLAAEDDDVTTFVNCVREESRTYPRPMPIETLENDPFRFSRDRVMRTWDAVRGSGDYPDIKQIAASNGDVFFYSDEYLSADYAASLAEWAAVERLRNV